MEFRQGAHVSEKPAADYSPTPAPAATGHTPAKTKRMKSIKRPGSNMLLWGLMVLLLAAAVGTAAYYVNRYHDSQKQVKKLASNPTITAQQEQQQLLDKVGKLTVLPAGETPTIATVTDISKLKDQAFFVNAVNGDKVLIYTQAKKAFLYRPSTNKIINIAPVNLGNSTQSTAPTGTSTTTKKP
jgi:hypothetical protein